LSTDTKRCVVALGLVALALWPPIHRGLVARYDVSPWRFFGWAMYCQPKIPISIDAFVDVDGVRLPLEQAVAERRAIAHSRFEFMQRRETWGTLVEPDEFSRKVLEAVPQADRAEIIVRHLGLDPATGNIAARTYSYRLYRSDP